MNIINEFRKFITMRIRRMKIKNRNFTILSSNCTAGVIYHDIGLRFLSPTINLFMDINDFFVFVNNLKKYKDANIVEIEDSRVTYPVGILKKEGLKDIRLNFVHYDSFENAVSKWKDRYSRINYNNMMVIAELGCESSAELIEQFNRLKYKKLGIVNEKYKNIQSCVSLDIYNQNYYWGKLLSYKKNQSFFTYRYLDDINYIDFINDKTKC